MPVYGINGVEIKVGDYLVKTRDWSCGEVTMRCTFFKCNHVREANKRMLVEYLASPNPLDIGKISGYVQVDSFRKATEDEIADYEDSIKKIGIIGIDYAANYNGTKFYIGDEFYFEDDFGCYTVEQIQGNDTLDAKRQEDGLMTTFCSCLEKAIITKSERQGIVTVEIRPMDEVDFETVFGGDC